VASAMRNSVLEALVRRDLPIDHVRSSMSAPRR
jgi:hypothetical protein